MAKRDCRVMGTCMIKRDRHNCWPLPIRIAPLVNKTAWGLPGEHLANRVVRSVNEPFMQPLRTCETDVFRAR